MKKYVFGVDVGGTTCKIGFFQADGTLMDKWEIPTDTKDNGINILTNIATEINRKAEREGISKNDVAGIGIGVPGPVTNNSVVSVCENIGWVNVNVAKDLGVLTGLLVKAENDANLATLGEMWRGNTGGSKNLILVTLGTGIGAGVIADGKIITGINGAAGEIGHMTVNYEEKEICACGRYGCLEQYGSATGIVRLAKRRLAKTAEDSALKKARNLTAKIVFDAAKEGDDTAFEIVEEAGRILGSALANVVCVTNPEVIVIGGGVSKAGDILTDAIKKYFDRNAFGDCRNVRFVTASLGNDAGIYGCARLILE